MMLLIDNREQTDPVINLAIEEYTVRHLPADKDYLLLYCNDSSVILGKHQNHVQEVNLKFCAENDIPIYRRISGGGTVYHDSGNLNFGIVTRRTLQNFNQYRDFLQPVLRALHRLNLQATLDKRNNIVYQGSKLSGNAQFTSRERLLSHGTLLVNADINNLRGSLSFSENLEIESRATRSIPARVTNISQLLEKEISYPIMQQVILDEISIAGKLEFSEKQWDEILELSGGKFNQHSWNLELSPPCLVRKWDQNYQGETQVEKGRIRSMMVREKNRLKGKEWNLSRIFYDSLYDYRILIDCWHNGSDKNIPFNPLDYLV